MKTLKKLFTALLLLCATAASAHDFEVDGFYYNVTDEVNKTVEVTYKGRYYDSYTNEYSGDVVIPETVTYGNVTYSVTSIGERAFRSCSGLTCIEIPNSVTSIGYGAFSSCSGLTSIVVDSENSVYDSRENCNAIIETATNTLIAGCKNTVIPNSVTTIGNIAFSGCTGLTSITIPNSVTSIGGGAFYGCTGLTSVTIGNSVTSIGDYAFYECIGLTSIEIPNSVTSIGNEAFYGCTGLTSIEIPNSVTTIGGGAFRDCSGLTSITIPNSVTSIGNSAFSHCSGLTSITIPNSVITIGDYAFYYCTGLTSVTIGNSVTSIGERTFEGCSGLTSIEIPNSVTSIGDYAFYDCDGLTSIIIPNSVTTIEESAFYGCTGLTSVTIGSGVTNIINSAFCACDALTSIVVDSENSVYDSRENCNAIIETATNTLITGCKNTVIPNSVTTIGNIAFSGCTGLTSITIPNSVTSIGNYAFNGCNNCSLVIMHSLNLGYSSIPRSLPIYVPSEELVTKYSEFSNNVGLIYSSDYTATPTTIRVLIKNNIPEIITAISFNNSEDAQHLLTGLEPDKYYSFPIAIRTECGQTAECSVTLHTEELVFNTLKAKATSNNCAVICAETNISEEESGTGFEWRRIDAPDLVPSEMSGCAVHEGVMEGALHNLSANTYYKYRPYYTAKNGNTYYGEWIGFGTADAYVYFTPTVHTYATARVGVNAARLSGYALPGSDDITEQGFEYWPTGKVEAAAPHSTLQNSDNIMKVTATGQRMSVVIEDLEYGTIYKCRAYVKTAKETVYGEEQIFETSYPTGISHHEEEENISVHIANGTVYIDGNNSGLTVNVYTLRGTVAYSGCDKEITLSSGTYIIKVGDTTKKVSIR